MNSILIYRSSLCCWFSECITIQDSIISLTWTAPFTLDITTNVGPDITYCVGVVNSTSSSTLHSECGITETEYEYPIPPDSACHDHMVTVTPVNPADNGTSSSIHPYPQDTECKCTNIKYNYICMLRMIIILYVVPQVNGVVSVLPTTYCIKVVSFYPCIV